MITKEQARAHLDHCSEDGCSSTYCRYARTVIALHDRVDRLTEALARSQRALKPFADCVFNDNGDCTVSDTYTLTAADYWNAQSAEQAARAILKETTHD